MMRDRRNAFIWAIGMWFLRRTMRKHAGGGQTAGRRWGGRLLTLLKLAAVAGIAYAAWRKFAGASKTPTL